MNVVRRIPDTPNHDSVTTVAQNRTQGLWNNVQHHATLRNKEIAGQHVVAECGEAVQSNRRVQPQHLHEEPLHTPQLHNAFVCVRRLAATPKHCIHLAKQLRPHVRVVGDVMQRPSEEHLQRGSSG